MQMAGMDFQTRSSI
ncbi:hypothetical protein [uncultured Clostridium sp.]